MSTIKLTGAVVVVTGGARGIGRATAELFAQRGSQVVIGDLDEPATREAAAAIGAGVLGLRLDVTSEDSYGAFLDEVGRRVGPPDVLVSNAGIMPLGAFADERLRVSRATIDVNLWGVVLGARLVLPGMLERKRGRIVNVASLAGRVPLPGAAVYSGTKFAVMGFTEALEEELVGTGVAVAAVLPAVVRTELSSGVSHRGAPTVDPEDVAAAIVRCCESNVREAVVPSWAAALARMHQSLPQRLVRPIARRLGLDRALHGVDPAARVRYSSRVDGAIDDPTRRR